MIKIRVARNIYQARREFGVKGLFRQLRSEYAEERRLINRAYQLSPKTPEFKKAYSANINQLKKDFAKDFRQLNPARAELRKVARNPIRKEGLRGYVNEFGQILQEKYKIPAIELKRTEIKRDKIINAFNTQANRFGRYGKTFNLKNLKINYKGKSTDLSYLLNLQAQRHKLSVSDRASLTRSLNRAVDKLKLIQPSKNQQQLFSLSGNLEKVKTKTPWIYDVSDDTNYEYASEVYTEVNGWVVTWYIVESRARVIDAKISERGEAGQFDVLAHFNQLTTNYNIDEDYEYISTIINRLKGQAR